jgi:hypothetical protein
MLLFCGLTILSSAQSESKKSEIIADSKTGKSRIHENRQGDAGRV